jgi:hypothetical protein
MIKTEKKKEDAADATLFIRSGYENLAERERWTLSLGQAFTIG